MIVCLDNGSDWGERKERKAGDDDGSESQVLFIACYWSRDPRFEFGVN